MTDKKKNGSDPTEHDGAFRVDVPDDLLEEAVSAVERRVSESKPEEEKPSSDAEPSAPGVDVDLEATNPEASADLENMSVEEMMAGGFLPEKVVTAFNEANSRVIESQIAVKEAREKSAALLGESDAFRKRVQREKSDAVKFANEGILKEFLPILDNLERALQHTDSKAGAASTGDAVREGVEITLRQFLHVLQKFGVTRVPTSKGTAFDPHMHEAVQQVETSELPNNSVANVFQSGFMLHERLLRPAMVAVARNAAQAAEAIGQVQTEEDERLANIRRVGAAAREARQAKREERARTASDVAADAADAAMSVVDETLQDVDASVDAGVEAALGFEADEETIAEEAPEAAAETEEEKLERIRRVGAAAREARREKREERAAGAPASEPAAASVPTVEESPEEKLERIRRAGAAAREARMKKKEDGGVVAPPAGAAAPPTPNFADEDLDNWESTVDAVRTDKSQGRR